MYTKRNLQIYELKGKCIFKIKENIKTNIFSNIKKIQKQTGIRLLIPHWLTVEKLLKNYSSSE